MLPAQHQLIKQNIRSYVYNYSNFIVYQLRQILLLLPIPPTPSSFMPTLFTANACDCHRTFSSHWNLLGHYMAGQKYWELNVSWSSPCPMTNVSWRINIPTSPPLIGYNSRSCFILFPRSTQKNKFSLSGNLVINTPFITLFSFPTSIFPLVY